MRYNRNVTVSGAKGTDTVLDQQFQRARLQLCGNCTWKFSNITIANDTKSSSAGNEMFVAAQLGARLVLQDANVLRLACPSPADALGVLSITPRSAAFQDGVTQQHYSTRDVSIQVRVHASPGQPIPAVAHVAGHGQRTRATAGGWWLCGGHVSLVQQSTVCSRQKACVSSAIFLLVQQ